VINGAVLGSPITHSLSPTLHKAAFDLLGIDGNYKAINVPEFTLKSFLEERSRDFDYFSITMPLKEEVLDLGFETDAYTIKIQSANCLYRKNNQWKLTSTDGSGFLAALEAAGKTNFQRVLVLGAGGTARAVVGALDSCSENLVVLGRSDLRREALESSATNCNFEYKRWTLDIDFAEFDLVVNTTPAGAADLLADSVRLGECRTLFDVIYKPWPTVLASRWADSGGTVINGLELLMYQGIDQLELALDRKLDRLALATHLRAVLKKAAK